MEGGDEIALATFVIDGRPDRGWFGSRAIPLPSDSSIQRRTVAPSHPKIVGDLRHGVALAR